jgi:hypothetical protein
MTINKTGYGLLHKESGNIVGFDTSSNEGGDFCCSTQYSLNHSSEHPWIVDDELTAAYVRRFSTEWYNAGYETPSHHYDADELQVIKIEIKTSVTHLIEQELPTYKEFIEERYNTPGKKYYDPGHVKYILKEMKQFPIRFEDATYSLYDLHDLMEERNKKE